MSYNSIYVFTDYELDLAAIATALRLEFPLVTLQVLPETNAKSGLSPNDVTALMVEEPDVGDHLVLLSRPTIEDELEPEEAAAIRVMLSVSVHYYGIDYKNTLFLARFLRALSRKVTGKIVLAFDDGHRTTLADYIRTVPPGEEYP